MPDDDREEFRKLDCGAVLRERARFCGCWLPGFEKRCHPARAGCELALAGARWVSCARGERPVAGSSRLPEGAAADRLELGEPKLRQPGRAVDSWPFLVEAFRGSLCIVPALREIELALAGAAPVPKLRQPGRAVCVFCAVRPFGAPAEYRTAPFCWRAEVELAARLSTRA